MANILKAAAVSPRVHLGLPAQNANEIIIEAKVAADQGARLIVFPELCISGYSCGDLFMQSALAQASYEAYKAVEEASKDINAVLVIGVPLVSDGTLFDCAAVISGGKTLQIICNDAPENDFGQFQGRYFSACEENGGLIYPFPEYPELSLDVLIGNTGSYHGGDIVVNITEGMDFVGRNQDRVSQMKEAASDCGFIMASCGFGESTTDCLYSGIKIAVSCGELLGKKCARHDGPLFAEFDVDALMKRDHSRDFDEMAFLDVKMAPASREMPYLPMADMDHHLKHAHDIQVRGLAGRMQAIGCKKAVIGISGGLDSTLALLVTVGAFKLMGLDLKNIYAYTMPCFGTSKTTRSFATRLMKELGVSYKEIDITDAVRAHLKDIGHDEENHNVAYENAQARERTQVLMDIANDIGAIVIGTGDMSEIALGWCTYNGDHMSNYGVNAGVPKTLVRLIVDYISRTAESTVLSGLLQEILNIPVSPELVPGKDGEIGQKTEDIIGPYEVHDFILYNFLRGKADPADIYKKTAYVFESKYGKDVIEKTILTFYKRFFASQFKRSCMPDGPQVLDVSLSPRCGFMAPSDVSGKLWIESLEKSFGK